LSVKLLPREELTAITDMVKEPVSNVILPAALPGRVSFTPGQNARHKASGLKETQHLN
jgi:hypothetical protein